MAKGSNQKMKIIYLMQLFTEKTDATHYITMVELAIFTIFILTFALGNVTINDRCYIKTLKSRVIRIVQNFYIIEKV